LPALYVDVFFELSVHHGKTEAEFCFVFAEKEMRPGYGREPVPGEEHKAHKQENNKNRWKTP
jgi:hypothetical protein